MPQFRKGIKGNPLQPDLDPTLAIYTSVALLRAGQHVGCHRFEPVDEILQTGFFQGEVAAATQGSAGGGAGQCPERGLAELRWGPRRTEVRPKNRPSPTTAATTANPQATLAQRKASRNPS